MLQHKEYRYSVWSLIVFGTAVALIGINRGIFTDEAYAILLCDDPVRPISDYLVNDNNFPLHYLLLKPWVHLLGISEFATRIPSVLFYLVGIFACYKTGVLLGRSRTTAFYCGFFYAISLQAINLAQKVRTYSLMGMLACISLFLFLSLMSENATVRYRLPLLILCNALGTFTHIWFFFLILAELFCYLVFSRKKGMANIISATALSLVPFALLWGQVFWNQLHHPSLQWIPPSDWTTPVRMMLEFYGGYYYGSFLVFLMVVFTYWKNDEVVSSSQDAKLSHAVWFLVLSTFAIPMAVSMVKSIYYPGRYSIVCLPALAVLLGTKLSARIAPKALTVLTVTLLILVLAVRFGQRDMLVEHSEEVRTYRKTDRYALEQIDLYCQPGDTMVFLDLSRASIQYYLRRQHRETEFNLVSVPTANAGHLGWEATAGELPILQAEVFLLSQQEVKRHWNGGNVWVFLGRDPRINDLVMSQFLPRFQQVSVLQVEGPFFRNVVKLSHPKPDPSIL